MTEPDNGNGHAYGQTNGDSIRTAERRSRVLALRKAGATYAQIVRAIEQWAQQNDELLPKGWDCRYAYKDVARELDKLYNQMEVDARIIRWLELERLDDMLRSLWPQAVRGEGGPDHKAIDRILKIMDRRMKLVPDLQQAAGENEVVVRVIGGIDLDDL